MIRTEYEVVPCKDLPGKTLLEIKNIIKADAELLNKYKKKLYDKVQPYQPIKYLELEDKIPFQTFRDTYMGMPMLTILGSDFLRNEVHIRIQCAFECEDESST